MSDPIEEKLADAAAALREETDEPASAALAAETRARMLATHRRSREQSPRPAVWLSAAAALVIVLGGSTAWAYWTGRLAPWIAPREATVIEAPHAIEPTTQPEEHVAPIETPIATTVAITADQASEVTALEATAARDDEQEDEATSVATPTRPAVDPRERAAYREAHALHFEAHDPADAIDAWDRYLSAYPSGRFALEARYNRALCLVRLGRMSEARTALEPFVEGTHGGYRQREATELVHALDAP